MEVFGMIGFVFALAALSMATSNSALVKKLQSEVEGLTRTIEDLRGGHESGAAE